MFHIDLSCARMDGCRTTRKVGFIVDPPIRQQKRLSVCAGACLTMTHAESTPIKTQTVGFNATMVPE